LNDVSFAQSTTPHVPESLEVIIQRDGNFIVLQGPRITRGRFVLDLTSTPKHFDMTITHGPAKGKTSACIYELKADSYRICASFRGKDRPAVFESTPDSGLISQVLKREKQSIKDALMQVGRQELAGTWQAVTYALDGKKASDDDMKKIKLVIDADGTATAVRDGKTFIASSIAIDPLATPMTIDVTFTEGEQKGKTARGIYKVEDDVLTICRAAPELARPTAFASDAGSGHTLMTYKRDKAPAK